MKALPPLGTHVDITADKLRRESDPRVVMHIFFRHRERVLIQRLRIVKEEQCQQQ